MKILKLMTGLVVCFAIAGIGAFSLIEQGVWASSAMKTSVENLVQTYYLDDLTNVKDRTAGSEGEKNMATKLENFCATNNFEYFNNTQSFVQEFNISATKKSQNVLAQIGTMAEKYVILGAHYDAVFVNDKSYGYNDNISGVVGVMETAKNLIVNTNFNVIIAFWGAEEVGCLGSQYFINNLPAEIKNNILLYINYDTIGAGDHRYYYANDFGTHYSKIIDKTFAGQDIKKYANELYAPHATNGINYTNLGLQSDNSSFLKAGINSLNYFVGNLNSGNGLGYFETVGHPRIMHTTDMPQIIEEVFGNEHFYENITAFANQTLSLLSSPDFTAENFAPNQVNGNLFSDVTLKICGVIFVVLGFGGYLIVYFCRYKKQ